MFTFLKKQNSNDEGIDLGKPMMAKRIQPKWKQRILQNSIVKMFILINWNLLKNGRFILTALGSSYSFNALLSFYLYLPLFADSKQCSIGEKVRVVIRNLKFI